MFHGRGVRESVEFLGIFWQFLVNFWRRSKPPKQGDKNRPQFENFENLKIQRIIIFKIHRRNFQNDRPSSCDAYLVLHTCDVI
jgi:hypothetical protein